MRKNDPMEDLEVWVKKYIAQNEVALTMKEVTKEKVINACMDQGLIFEVLDDAQEICEQLSEVDSKLGFALDLSSFFGSGYEVLLVRVAGREPETQVFIFDSITIDEDSSYAQADYRLITRNKIKEFAALFLMDAWEPEALFNYEFVFVIKDKKLFEQFFSVLQKAKTHSAISVVSYEDI